ncbi:DUF1684 domain-containing protein [Urechidicola vernalis]|uniref:DUF1684 domain-containing protein n=1 Tax=Urechidicola vernalis TaxID=3075600 RepID=A0ABU2Y3P7_9FLAO|nr:DUF1684 domain-containing protein [Urechidicola sp. P050]MDT0552829.1 DUF1684 domain-containing protein [Urechidicola sp. P050]
MTHKEEIEQFRYKMNVEFSDLKTTPLKKKDFKKFKELAFFEIDASFKIEASFKSTPNEPIFEMQTTTDRKPLYTQYGIATFKHSGKEHTLRIYQNQELMLDPEYADHLFIPFNDLTNGAETYDGGRYIDVDIPKGEIIVIDFNKSYNPYCAYNDEYSCPIPPRENDLDLAIKAGVLAFKKH